MTSETAEPRFRSPTRGTSGRYRPTVTVRHQRRHDGGPSTSSRRRPMALHDPTGARTGTAVSMLLLFSPESLTVTPLVAVEGGDR